MAVQIPGKCQSDHPQGCAASECGGGGGGVGGRRVLVWESEEPGFQFGSAS